MAETYDIRVRGHLDNRWSKWFDGATVRREADGTTVLSVTVPDQAALHGVISRIRDLGLPLLSVVVMTESNNDTSCDDEIGGGQTTKSG